MIAQLKLLMKIFRTKRKLSEIKQAKEKLNKMNS